ncbi:MAG: hypothetical protein CVU26_09035 [Betaproteobacteria bacterium HGW-Betaproteobacteria-2]|jgi:hypothetical protein|nr:MAG: hypothetical protein CVU26_09035 [Betaproteobacteria bacterium HGW-Betaproteobacteria-2]
MKLVLAPFNLNDPNDPDWTIQPQKFSESFAQKANKSAYSPINYELRITNHGLGADWPTVTIIISSAAGLLLFVIPEAHKRVRESLEEWVHIKKTTEALINWVARPKDIIQYPIELLYLDALTYVLEKSEKENSVFS